MRPGNDVSEQGTAGVGPTARLGDHAATRREYVKDEPARKHPSGWERLCDDDERMALMCKTVCIVRF